MAAVDPLDGYRGPAALAANVERMAPESDLWGRLYLGDAASKIMRGVAERKDIAKVMAHMIARCELDVQQACSALVAETSLDSDEARRAHFEARVSAGILGRMNQYIRDGIAASNEFNQRGET